MRRQQPQSYLSPHPFKKEAAPTMEPLLVTAAEAAALLSLSRSKVYQLIDSGQLESRHIGRAVRILRSSLVRFVDEQAA